ncbi:hypothetical protein EJ08DRAFT_658774 [Tothia fuscella]|uniref:Uncharacterized protein n=1 Tax=Tothia fuscella TaxID=1048955 RepID=A0A9P4NX26_9PEZI|nr:hypothetical protein EJ08DRAFT_658774 [Tothia fuscella]
MSTSISRAFRSIKQRRESAGKGKEKEKEDLSIEALSERNPANRLRKLSTLSTGNLSDKIKERKDSHFSNPWSPSSAPKTELRRRASTFGSVFGKVKNKLTKEPLRRASEPNQFPSCSRSSEDTDYEPNRFQSCSRPTEETDYGPKYQQGDMNDIEVSYGRRVSEANEAAVASVTSYRPTVSNFDMEALSLGGLSIAAERVERNRAALMEFEFGLDGGATPVGTATAHSTTLPMRSNNDEKASNQKKHVGFEILDSASSAGEESTSSSGSAASSKIKQLKLTPYPSAWRTTTVQKGVRKCVSFQIPESPPSSSSSTSYLKQRRMTPYPAELHSAVQATATFRIPESFSSLPESSLSRREEPQAMEHVQTAPTPTEQSSKHTRISTVSFDSAPSTPSDDESSSVQYPNLFTSLTSWLGMDEAPRFNDVQHEHNLSPEEYYQATSQDSSSAETPSLYQEDYFLAPESPMHPPSDLECRHCKEKWPPYAFTLPTAYCIHTPSTCPDCVSRWVSREIHSGGPGHGICCLECRQIFGYEDVRKVATAEDLDKFVTDSCFFDGGDGGKDRESHMSREDKKCSWSSSAGSEDFDFF